MGEQGDEPLPGAGRPRPSRRLLLLAAAGAALLIALVVGVTVRPAAVAGDERPVTATSSARSTAHSTTRSAPAPAAPGPTVEADPAALADLDAVASTLTTPLALTSPAAWDQWLPEGKPYPGANTEDDMSTCPRLADRLGTALGTRMSYWVGTLPGPGGCRWATVPLKSGPDAPKYPYLGNVDFVGDGSTAEQLSGRFYHHQGRLCPGVAVPGGGDGAYLVRCEELDGITYSVITRDTRTAGVWILSGSARSDAARPATDVLRPVIEGVVAAFG